MSPSILQWDGIFHPVVPPLERVGPLSIKKGRDLSNIQRDKSYRLLTVSKTQHCCICLRIKVTKKRAPEGARLEGLAGAARGRLDVEAGTIVEPWYQRSLPRPDWS